MAVVLVVVLPLLAVVIAAVVLVKFWNWRFARSTTVATASEGQSSAAQLSVNYHFTRNCNYSCGFCFHTAKAKDVLPKSRVKHGLELLKATGVTKINFSGGEPFLHAALLGFMVQCCHDMGINVSIVSNGSLIREEWLEKFANYVDILAISCDSFDNDCNEKIGRLDQHDSSRSQAEILTQVASWCRQYSIVFKMNTVINQYNWEEDMSNLIHRLAPSRWKVFQCLRIEGENSGSDALRDVEQFLINKEQFDAFVNRHRQKGLQPVPENNEDMKDSYLILDEKMRFLNCTGGSKKPSGSILDIGVEQALKDSGFDEAAFIRRGGIYPYSKSAYNLCESSSASVPDIEDL